MKKITLLFLLVFLSVFSKAQITLEVNGTPPELKMIHLKYSGYKYAAASVVSDSMTITLYNLNHTIFKIINVPAQGGFQPLYVQYIAEDLWDTVSTDIAYASIGQTNVGVYYTKIFNENGNLLFSNDSATFFYELGNSNFSNPVSVPIVNTDSGTKLILWHQIDGSNSIYDYSLVYSLPGTLECLPCTNGGATTDVKNYMITPTLSNPYPNPTKDLTTIPYTLPEGENTGEIIFYDITGKEIKRFKVDRTFDKLYISTADLASGTYYYQLQTSKENSQGKKIIHVN